MECSLVCKGPLNSRLCPVSLAERLIAQLVKNPPAMQETLGRFLGQEDPLDEGMVYPFQYSSASLAAQLVKNPPAMWETWV